MEACRILFTVDVQYTGSIEHAQASSGSSTEQPSCPVCLGMHLSIGKYKLYIYGLLFVFPCVFNVWRFLT